MSFPSHASVKGLTEINWAAELDRVYADLKARDLIKQEVALFEELPDLRLLISDYSTCAIGQLDARIPRIERKNDCTPLDRKLNSLGHILYVVCNWSWTFDGADKRRLTDLGIDHADVDIARLTIEERYTLATRILKAIEVRGAEVLAEVVEG